MKNMMVMATPGKLSGENIPFLARITALADAFDAMTSRRTYRDALDVSVVKNEISKNIGIQFDPEIAKAFLDILDNNYTEIEKIQLKYK